MSATRPEAASRQTPFHIRKPSLSLRMAYSSSPATAILPASVLHQSSPSHGSSQPANPLPLSRPFFGSSLIPSLALVLVWVWVPWTHPARSLPSLPLPIYFSHFSSLFVCLRPSYSDHLHRPLGSLDIHHIPSIARRHLILSINHCPSIFEYPRLTSTPFLLHSLSNRAYLLSLKPPFLQLYQSK